MDIKQLDAVAAYGQAKSQFTETKNAASGADAEEGSAFSSLVGDMMENVREATQASEVASAKALTGEADMLEVVSAISNAELVVDTVVRVRDKVMAAYQQIAKMPI